jgi:hypothetical protein
VRPDALYKHRLKIQVGQVQPARELPRVAQRRIGFEVLHKAGSRRARLRAAPLPHSHITLVVTSCLLQEG